MSDDPSKPRRTEVPAEIGGTDKGLESAPDVPAVRNASVDVVKSAQRLNQDNWRSNDGHFAITNGDEVLASQNVNESRKALIENVSETGTQLSLEARSNPALEPVALLRKYADKLPEGEEKRSLVELSRKQGAELSPSIRERLEGRRYAIASSELDQGGIHHALTPNEVPPGGLGSAFLHSKPEVQNALIKALQDCPEIMSNRLDVAISNGVYKGVRNWTDVAVALGLTVWRTIEFTSDVMTNNPRALKTGEKVGSDIGSAIVGGVRIFEFADLYSQNIQETGDYEKPIRDIVWLKEQLNAKWNRMSEFEKQECIAESTTNLALGGLPTWSLARSSHFTRAIEDLGQTAAKLGGKSQQELAIAIRRMIDKLGPQVKAVDAATGLEIEVPAGRFEDLSMRMVKHKGDGNDTPKQRRSYGEGDEIVRSPHKFKELPKTVEVLLHNPVKFVSDRIDELKSQIPKKAMDFGTTMSSAIAKDADGKLHVLVSTNEETDYLRKGVELKPWENFVTGETGDAEMRIKQFAENHGLKLIGMGATRPICEACESCLRPLGVKFATILKSEVRKKP